MSDTKKKIADWERIELDYRSGILTLREIAEANGITHGAINKRAKRDGWVRDLKAKIQAKAAELVSKREVSKKVSKEKLATEREVIEINAEMQANTILDHRTDIRRHRSLSLSLLKELEAQTGDPALFEKLGEMLATADDKGMDKLNDIYRRVISTPGRIDSMKKLSDTLKTLVALEREAFGLDDGKIKSAGDALDEFLKSLDGGAATLLPG